MMTLSLSRYKSHIKNSGLYLSSTIIISLIQVVVNPLFAINMSKEDYAAIGFYQGFSMLFTPLIGFYIIDFYLKKYYTITVDERISLKATVIKLFVGFSAIVTLLSLAGLLFYVRLAKVSIAYSPYAILTLAQIYCSLLFSFQLAECRIMGDAKNFFYYTILNGITVVALSLLFVAVIKWGGAGKLLGALLASLTFFVYILIKNHKLLKEKINFDLIKEMLKYSTPLVMAGMLGFFSSGFDKVLLERNVDIATLGIYSIGLQFAGYINLFSSAIKSTFQPDVYKAISEKNMRKAAKVIVITIFIIALVVITFIVICPFLIKVLTAGRFVDSVLYARIAAIGVVTSSIYYQISQLTYGSGLTKLTLYNKIIGTLFTILLFTVMIPTYGALGAAWASVLSYVIYASCNVILLSVNKKHFLK